ncbi:MAG: ABC-ATPase domain-containing protein [Lachnospiraceae bacterium]|nr:ABC-ATPase domain-containing protein [Lachnospiraceae bacterium]
MNNRKTSAELRTLLKSIDHRSYPAYKAMAGEWRFPGFLLVIDHVQGDPFASPSSLHVEIETARTGFPESFYEKDCTRTALQDFLTRQLSAQFERYNFKAKGSGKSGLLSVSRCGQEVLERSACEIRREKLIVRFQVGFPAFGRTIQAGELEKILFEFLPSCIENSLFYARLDKKRVEKCVFLAEDQEELRGILAREGLVCFVANGSILPRKSGISNLPLEKSVPFTSPASMERTFRLPHYGDISGMAIPKGVTLIAGGGYHGKSTLLEAVQSGVYNHIAGDGREYVITDDTAVKLRAEDGRSIRNVDISLFINDLPNKKDTTSFTTADASGSTSQAAAVMESVEAGTRLLLVDEDTSATNFMVRDELMQRVISRDKEPITPFIERLRDLYEKAGISTIMVAGSSGAFFYTADHILLMDCYRAVDITQRVKSLCGEFPAPRLKAPEFTLPSFNRVFPVSARRTAADESAGGKGGGERHRNGRQDRGGRHERKKIKTFGMESFSLDKENVNVHYLEQLADQEQTAALAYLLRFGLEQALDGRRNVRQAVQFMYDALEKKGWEALCSSYVPCGLAKPRIQELFASLNRYRG